MADGLKQHSHADRERIVAALVPLIQRHMGGELVALAAAGSFARGTDDAYSDLELLAFVRRRPGGDRAFSRFIHDGLLIDLTFLTREEYLEHFKRRIVWHEWPYQADGALLPLVNDDFVRELATTAPNKKLEDRATALRNCWSEVQEATAKLLNAIARNDLDPVPYLYWRMVDKLCAALSLFNARPYTTRATIFAEARTFPYMPEHFELLMLQPGSASDATEIGRRALIVFEEMEALLHSQGLKLYEQSLDAFVSPLSGGQKLRRRLQIDRVLAKVAKIGGLLRLKPAPGH